MALQSVTHRTEDLSAWAWLWLAAAPFVMQMTVWWAIGPSDVYNALFEGEGGIIENLTVLALAAVLVLALLSARLAHRRGLRDCAVMLIVFAAASFVLIGEEISWGQHLFGWQSPEYFVIHNKQGETNLHNMSGINKNLPKWLLVICIAAGGVLIPFGAKLSGVSYRPARHSIIWLIPTLIGLPSAVFVFVSHVIAKITRLYGWDSITERLGFSLRETTELYIAIFLLLYAASLYLRLRQAIDIADEELVVGP